MTQYPAVKQLTKYLIKHLAHRDFRPLGSWAMGRTCRKSRIHCPNTTKPRQPRQPPSQTRRERLTTSITREADRRSPSKRPNALTKISHQTSGTLPARGPWQSRQKEGRSRAHPAAPPPRPPCPRKPRRHPRPSAERESTAMLDDTVRTCAQTHRALTSRDLKPIAAKICRRESEQRFDFGFRRSETCASLERSLPAPCRLAAAKPRVSKRRSPVYGD